jgi:predicted MPP superfamily phosphohydrolase
MFDIIPDIHGQADKLWERLIALGYSQKKGAWRHPDPERVCVFLGDFIDRGPSNGQVIDTVRRMLDAGTAYAVMGNHELNAILYHTTDPRSLEHPDEVVDGLRKRSPKNTRQHQTFLDEFPLGSSKAEELIAWMRTLPLFLEFENFRVVHACWDEARIARLNSITRNGVLTEDQFVEAADRTSTLFDLVEATTKGPESAFVGGRRTLKAGPRYRPQFPTPPSFRTKYPPRMSWIERIRSLPSPYSLVTTG